MRRAHPYRREAETAEPLSPRAPTSDLGWTTLMPLGVVLVACSIRVGFACAHGGRWGGEPTLALVIALVAARLMLVDVRAWRRTRSRSSIPS